MSGENNDFIENGQQNVGSNGCTLPIQLVLRYTSEISKMFMILLFRRPPVVSNGSIGAGLEQPSALYLLWGFNRFPCEML